MKIAILTLIALGSGMVFAQSRNTETGCFESVTHKSNKGAPLGSNDAAVNVTLQITIKEARESCKPESAKFGECLSRFLDDLQACEGVGDQKTQAYVGEIRQAALAHATPNPAKPVRMTKEDRGAKK